MICDDDMCMYIYIYIYLFIYIYITPEWCNWQNKDVSTLQLQSRVSLPATYLQIRNFIIHIADAVSVRCAEEVSVCAAVTACQCCGTTNFIYKTQFVTLTTASLIWAHFYKINKYYTVCLHREQQVNFRSCCGVLFRLRQASAADICRISCVSGRCVAAMYRVPWTSALPQQSVGRDQELSRATGHTDMVLWNVCKHIPDYTASHLSMQVLHSSICS